MLVSASWILSTLALVSIGAEANAHPREFAKRQDMTTAEVSVPAVTDSLLLAATSAAAAAATGIAGGLGISEEELSSLIASLQTIPGALESASEAIASLATGGVASSLVASLTSEYSIPSGLASSASEALASVTSSGALASVTASASEAASSAAAIPGAASSAAASASSSSGSGGTSGAFPAVGQVAASSFVVALGVGLGAAFVL